MSPSDTPDKSSSSGAPTGALGKEKSIHTVVPDIYDVLQNPTRYDWSHSEAFAKDLGEHLAKRAQDTSARAELRMSNFGTPCNRKLWYTVNKPETAEPLDPWVRLKFLYGDLVESLVLFLLKVSGHKVTGEQSELVLEGIKGHRDAIVDGVLVDVKSANSRGMAKFKGHTLQRYDPFGYLDQLSLYLEASSKDPDLKVKKQGAFIAVDKELGHIVLDVYDKKDVDYRAEIATKKDILAQENPPRKPYSPVPEGKSGNLALPVECSYCQFKKECWKDANREQGLRGFFYSSGPKWLTHVAREPDVPEMK